MGVVLALAVSSSTLAYVVHRSKSSASQVAVTAALGFVAGAIGSFLIYFATHSDEYPLSEAWGRGNWVTSAVVLSIEASVLAVVAFLSAGITLLILRLSRKPGAV